MEHPIVDFEDAQLAIAVVIRSAMYTYAINYS